MASESADFKIEQRAYVKIRTLLQVCSTDIHKDLLEVYNDRTLPYSTIVDWSRRFREGRESIEDKHRAGRETLNNRRPVLTQSKENNSEKSKTVCD